MKYHDHRALPFRILALALALGGLLFAPAQQARAQQPAGPLGVAVPHRYLVILTLPSERVAHRRTGFGLSSGCG